jgi:hypothetical protein
MLIQAQSGFGKRRPCMDGIFIIKELVRKRTEYNPETHLLIGDYENALICLLRSKLWRIVEIKGFPAQLIRAIKCLYTSLTAELKVQRKLK